MENYYCSQKFYQLQINAEKKRLNSCCKADPEIIDINWLKKNPGEIFNTPKLKQERKDMLDNVRIAGCEDVCWKKEAQGLWSRRMRDKTFNKTHTNIKNKPTHLNLTLSSDCNLACSYCCKDFSSAWRNEIFNHGPYEELDEQTQRFSLNSFDLAVKKASQKKKQTLEIFDLIEHEVEKMSDHLQSVTITGGEPLLHYKLPDVVRQFSKVKWLTVYTGLGVSESVLLRALRSLSQNHNVEICVSAESTGKNFEFNRFGSKWEKFIRYLEIIKSYGIKVTFNMSYGNLNVIDFVEFNNMFEEYEKKLNMIYDPMFLSVSNLDDESKELIMRSIKESRFSNSDHATHLIKALEHKTNEKLRSQLGLFLKQMCKRRKNNIDFMPSSFKNWIGID